MKLHWRRRTAEAFTLLEIMIVVIIIGILAATLGPQFFGTTTEARVNATKGHLSEIELAVDQFHLHMDRYPSTEEGLKVLMDAPSGEAGEQSHWRGPYLKRLLPDPWGNPYQYRAPGTHHPTSYDVWSCGADKVDGGDGKNADIGNW